MKPTIKTMVGFTSGLKQGEFLFSIYKNDPKTMVETLYKATKYMNVEDVMIAQGDAPRKGKVGRPSSR